MNRTYVPYDERSEHVHYKGAWASGAAYNYGDEVANDGALFVCILAHTSSAGLEPIPAADEVIVGPTGPTGATGATGLQGPKGDAGVAASNQSIETPSGTMNGTNQTFTLAHTPAGNIELFWNGSLLKEGVGYDFTISGTTITLLGTNKPNLGDNLIAVYVY